LRYHPSDFEDQFILHFLRDLGIGFLVACGLAWAIEARAQEERTAILAQFSADAQNSIRKASENALEFYFKKDMPAGWFDFFRESLATTNFIRSYFKARMVVLDPDVQYPIDAGDCIIAEITFAYRVRNISSKEQRLTIAGGHTVPPGKPDWVKLVQLTELRVNNLQLAPGDVEAAISRKTATARHWFFEHAINLPQGGFADVRYTIRGALARSGKFTLSSVHPAEALSVELQPLNKTLMRLEILHPNSKGRLFAQRGSPAIEEIDRPISPYSAVVIEWSDQNLE
jgi:hypothetical protein